PGCRPTGNATIYYRIFLILKDTLPTVKNRGDGLQKPTPTDHIGSSLVQVTVTLLISLSMPRESCSRMTRIWNGISECPGTDPLVSTTYRAVVNLGGEQVTRNGTLNST